MISIVGNQDINPTEAHLPGASPTEQGVYPFPEAWHTSRDYTTQQCLHQLLEDQVERTPQAIALICEGQQLTFGELNRQANQLAHYLQTLNVGPEILVGLYIERSLDMLIALFGILKAGGAYVPLDPTFPAERIALLLEDIHAPVIVTQSSLVDNLPVQHPRCVCLDTERESLAQQSRENPTSAVKGENLAYILYTSGSTGQPKGVLVEHHSIAAHCLAMIDAQELTATDGSIAFSTLSFDASLEQMLPTLLAGGHVVVRGQKMWTPAELLHLIKAYQLTAVSLPTAYWHQTIAEWAKDPEQLIGHPLRLLLTGGDRFPVELAQLWRQTPLRSARFFNVYGPTEATITTALYNLPHTFDEMQPEGGIPLGSPFANHRTYLLDEANQPVPVGVAGELHIGGSVLARGYLNRPDLTTQRFIPDPFSQQPQARMYKTGDLARYRSDGVIEFLGRIDQQVKIHDRRIELGEIEFALSQHPAIRQVAVIAREDRPGVKRLVAYTVLRTEQTASSEELKQYAMKALPDYMVPTAFVFLEAFPLTSNTKIDQRALPIPESAQFNAKGTFVAPTLPLHYQLVQIWEDLLNIRPISITDDFFDLGGHSLLAARLIDRIEHLCGKKIPIALLHTGATIEYLTAILMGKEPEDTQKPFIAFQIHGSQRPFFYMHGQLEDGKVFHSHTLAKALGPDRPFYSLKPYPLVGPENLPTLEQMAAAHIDIMRSIQPTGPYLLGGTCNGGLLAYEMARQLRAAGEKIDLLILLDPVFLVYPRAYRWYYTIFEQVSKLFRLNSARRIEWALRLKYAAKMLFLKLKREQLPEVSEADRWGQYYFRLYDWIALGYKPSSMYDGKITFFWAQEGFESHAFRKGWREIEAKGQIEVHTIPGDHETCRSDYLPILAAHLADCVKRAEEH